MNTLSLSVNGSLVTREVEPRTHLADFIREDLHLTGTHIGCEHGVCGACTMLVDGRAVRSCLTLASSCGGADVRTIEGYDTDPIMTALRAAFSRHHALQCGYCTPGMLTTAYDIVTRLPRADEARIREDLAGNLCRCTGYMGIVAAVKQVLSDGPHQATFLPLERPLLERGTSPTIGGPAALKMKKPAAKALEVPAEIRDGVSLHRSLAVAVDAEKLWDILKDTAKVARCLPGASIESIDELGVVTGAFTVAVGPMRATFAGQAQVALNDEKRIGSIRGSGGDGNSRSRADGMIIFSAVTDGDALSRIDIEITYKLKGPLAQFGRPAIVADVVDRLLDVFAKNLAKLAEGADIVETRPLSGIGVIIDTMLNSIRRLILRQ